MIYKNKNNLPIHISYIKIRKLVWFTRKIDNCKLPMYNAYMRFGISEISGFFIFLLKLYN